MWEQMALNLGDAVDAFVNVFTASDGSAVSGVSGDVVTQLLEETVTRRWGVRTPADVCALTGSKAYEVLMYASLGLFADTAKDPSAWARVQFDSGSAGLRLVPSVEATRQYFADVVVILSIIALARVWVRTATKSSAGEGV
jgi:high-affinity K+ transport system ATPase subunit B